MTAHYSCIWEFVVPEARRTEFESHYAPCGTWGQLFRDQPGYIGTVLLHDRERPSRYLTIDRWVSETAYDAFRDTCAEQYARLDKQCDGLATEENFLGSFVESSS